MKKLIRVLSLFAITTVLGLNIAITQNNSTNAFSLDNVLTLSTANAEGGGEITVDCSDNIRGDGSITFRECEPECPKKDGTTGPDNGECTYYF